jgi:pyrimidine-nucleoside phosphorylase
MRAYDIILKKRSGLKLSAEEIGFIVHGYTQGLIPDYQASALLMAIYFNGMDAEETSNLTWAMMNSGKVLDLKGIPGPKVDKHSTGGVGDKVSIILAPLAAAAGLVVPMMSGRGLGFSGGTLDKLQSIPGFRTDLSEDEFISALSKVGLSMIGQTEDIAPADRKLYALRDATATVESIPLIASSIMSKKLAEGARSLVLDVKTGSGAFMKTYEKSLALAETLVDIGDKMGVKTVAFITDMDQPLGYEIGNAVEVKECIEVMKGESDERSGDLVEVTLTLGSAMLLLGGVATSGGEARTMLQKTLADGRCLGKFRQMVEVQGGDVGVADDPSVLPQSKNIIDVLSPRSGYIRRINAEAVGFCTLYLGAGRSRSDDRIDPAVGVTLKAKVGRRVEKGEPLASIHANDASDVDRAIEVLSKGYVIGDEEPKPSPLVKSLVTKNGVRAVDGGFWEKGMFD